MLTKIWTTAIVLSAAASLVAWVCVAAHARGIRPLRAIARFAQKLSLAGVVVFGLMAAPLYRAGSTKVGGGTNNVPPNLNQPLPQMQQGGILSQIGFTGLTGFVGEGNLVNSVNPVQDPITSTNTTRTLTAEDFVRGFVMARVGTGEDFDFTPPQNAVIVADWHAFGAAKDWIYVAMTNWMFKVGTNNVERLRIYSFGKIEPLIREVNGSIATNNWFAPFMASLGVVPEANWHLLGNGESGTYPPSEASAEGGSMRGGNGLESQVWYCITPDNTLVVTWQNALLGRDTGKPISFQVEFFTDGRFVFRYDLSRLDGETAVNFLAGASFGGNEWSTNSLPTNVTSMAFYPLSEDDAYDQDPDGDGLLTIDELFFYNTDPHNADSDYDGLNDGDELLAYNSDPLDPNSISAAYCDGLAAKLGDLDPFSCPEGSTNAVLEHIFYSGTTNGVFTYPTSTVDTAVLEIMVSGEGTGRLVVADAVVPLVAPPPMRSGAATNTLLLAVGKGVQKSLWWDKPDGLDLVLRSDDLLIGRMPTWYLPHGWLAFPHTEATAPCIHDFVSNGKTVSLVHGEEFPGLTATWTNGNADVEIENLPPNSAEIYGHFAKNQERTIFYTVDHPDRLNKEPPKIEQTLCFCPNLAADDAPPGAEDEDFDSSEWPVQSGTPEVEDTTSEAESAAEYARIAGLPLAQGVLQLHGSLGREDAVALSVPMGAPVRCCDCPDHWQSNYVAAAWMSPRLSVRDAEDNGFDIAYEDVVVSVRGEYPSREPYGDGVLFVTNGAPSFTKAYTVLGVDIENLYGPALSEYASLNASFGFPITVNTNLDNAVSLRVMTDVLLTNGVFRLALEDCVGSFEIWAPEWTYFDYSGGGPELVTIPAEKLLDSADSSVRYFTVRQWRQVVSRHAGSGRDLDVLLLSSATGHCDFAFSYEFDNDGSAIRSSVSRRISSVMPPLLPDYNGDGMVDAVDFALFMCRKIFRFWTNKEKVKGRYVGDGALSTLTLNIANDTVDGDYDMLNFFPLALDLAQFPQSWKSGLSFKLKAPGSSDASFNYCLSPGAWAAAGEMYTNDVLTVSGETLSAAHVTPVNHYGTSLPIDSVGAFPDGHGLVVAEAMREGASLRLSVVDSTGYEFYGFTLPSMVVDVERMYRWANLRPVCGDSSGEGSDLANPLWNPDSESDGRHFVFVHGYNVNAEAARVWANQMFKRLWVAGSRSMFTAVDWYGDSSQYFSLIYMDTVSPDYYANVMHAFATASNLVDTVASLPGTNKVMLAHSLGNMLVSSAAVDHNLQYDRYYMLNAAVPMEAYDVDSSTSNMVDSAWSNVPENYRASGWSNLYDNTNDFRRLLSWQGRFAGIANAVNCYSPTEDVLENASEHGYGSSWAKQELFKGTAVWHGLNTVLFFNDSVSCEGGWGINTYYAANPSYYIPLVGLDASVSNLTREAVIEHPLFTPFRAESDAMHSTNLFTIADADYRAQLRAKFLGDAIPATSFAAGANEISGNAVCGNINYADCRSGTWPIGEGKWRHSDIKNVAYFFNWKLFKLIINSDRGVSNANQQ